MIDEDKLPDVIEKQPRNNSPKFAPPLQSTDGYVIEVTLHDKNDIVMDRSYMFLSVGDAEKGEIVCSNISYPLTTEDDVKSD